MEVSPRQREHTTESRSNEAITVALATLLSVALIVAMSGDAWRWPFQYGDDLIFDVSTWSYRDEKLPGEARWVVWLWHQIFSGQSAATDFRLSLLGWCASMALIARQLTTGARWPTIVCAVALSANPAVLELMQWPHTAVPMMATMLGGAALLSCNMSTTTRTGIALAVGACAAMLAFQLFALLLIAVALLIVTARALRASEWTAGALLRDATTVVCWGIAGTCAGLLVGFALNEFAFGHFGLDIASWRQRDNGSVGLATVAATNIHGIFLAASRASGHVLWPVMLATTGLWGAAAMRARRSTRAVRRTVWLVLLMLSGVVVAPLSVALLSGAPVPDERGGLTVWFAAIAVFVLLSELLAPQLQRGAVGAMAALTAITMWRTGDELAAGSRLRQVHDLHLARIERDVRAALGDDGPARTLVAVGAHHPFDSVGSNDDWWVRALLRSRLEPALAGGVIYCASTSCPALRAQSFPQSVDALSAYPHSGYVRRRGDVLLITFNAGDQAAEAPSDAR